MEPYYRFEPLEPTGRRYSRTSLPSSGLWAQLAATLLGGLGTLLLCACNFSLHPMPAAAICGWSAALLVAAWWPRRPMWTWWVLIATGAAQFLALCVLCFGIVVQTELCLLIPPLMLALVSLVQVVDSIRALRSGPDYHEPQPRGFEVQVNDSEREK